jgi:glycosyltransferase involved in cell wall biosynthesis
MGLRLSAKHVRRADLDAAASVDVFIANSRHVADRIKRNYGRPSVVLHPPVDVDFPCATPEPGEFYLVLSELVHYKRVELAVDACTRLHRPLVVVGTGPRLNDLRRRAGSCVQLLGWQSDEVVRDHLRRCRALLFCGEEDFGLTPVEAMAAGRPVIAYRAGGATETVLDGRTGLFFDEQTVTQLENAIHRFEQLQSGPPTSFNSSGLWSPAQIQEHAASFSIEAFRLGFERFYRWALEEYRSGGCQSVRAASAALNLAEFDTRQNKPLMR